MRVTLLDNIIEYISLTKETRFKSFTNSILVHNTHASTYIPSTYLLLLLASTYTHTHVPELVILGKGFVMEHDTSTNEINHDDLAQPHVHNHKQRTGLVGSPLDRNRHPYNTTTHTCIHIYR